MVFYFRETTAEMRLILLEIGLRSLSPPLCPLVHSGPDAASDVVFDRP